MTGTDALPPPEGDYTKLELDQDEAQHLRWVSQQGDASRWLGLANDGALLTINCIITWSPELGGVESNSPAFIRALLALKCANLLRLSTSALSIGYYTGTATLLRAAYEALAYDFLFDDSPDEIKLWLKLELQSIGSRSDTEEKRREQWKRAKESFSGRVLDAKLDRRFAEELWDRCTKDIHTSVLGLARDWGVDFRGFLPDEFWAQFEKSEGNWDFALSMLTLGAVIPIVRSAAERQEPPSKEEVRIELVGRYDADELSSLSEMALFLAHRLADLTFDTFQATDSNLRTDFDKWHREVKKG